MSTNVKRCIGRENSLVLVYIKDFWDCEGLLETTYWRRRRDSNPRYSFPYGTLAMCWFQPLTHSSVGIPDLNGVLSPEDEFYAISGIWQVVMGVNSFLQPDLDRYRPRPPASI